MEHRASLSAAEREIDRIEVRRKKLIEMVMEGVPPSEVKDELTANAARREELKAKLAAANAPPTLLHPEMAELYRMKVSTLAQALEQQAYPRRGHGSAPRPHRRHHPDAGRRRAQNRTEGEPGGHAERRHKYEEVARNRRPLAAS